MRTKKAVLAIDQGTTGTRAVLYGTQARVLGSAYQEFRQYYPCPGWVEHDPEEIWESVVSLVSGVLRKSGLSSSEIAAIGITNQRETAVLWDRESGKPVYRAIVWQDRRTASLCEQLKRRGYEEIFRSRTGLVVDPYFSGTKIRWLLDHVQGSKRKAQRGKILFGTIDSWLLWKLTGGKVHATDITNASRTLLFNIRTRRWDKSLLRILKIPPVILPRVCESAFSFGETMTASPFRSRIPIRAIMGDQQAALYGQGCYRPGEAKNTYGTGCFVVVNAGPRFRKPPFGLLATIACNARGKPVYAFEGSIFIAGAAVQWLRDGMGFFKRANQTEALAKKLQDSQGVTVIPALTGLGSPYWNPHVRGMITGLTRGTRREHIVRATLESIAQQTVDVLERMKAGGVSSIRVLKVDGGATANRFLMQFQADLAGIPILVSDLAEATAWGVAKLAAQGIGFWPSLGKIDKKRHYRRFYPRRTSSAVRLLRASWKREIQRLLS